MSTPKTSSTETSHRHKTPIEAPVGPAPKPESFLTKQLKLASSTAVVSSVATLAVSFWINLAVFGVFIFIAILGASALVAGSESSDETIYGNSSARHRLLSINITGPIEGTGGAPDGLGSLFGADSSTYGYDVKERLIAAVDEDYDGIILEIDSPGGTIYGSKAISDGIKQYRELTGQPVYAHVQGMAASGAYWVAAESSKILADAGTGIGSIGVIFGPFTFYNNPTAVDGGLLGGGVVTQGGIEETYITAGEGKDAGNPYRRLTDKEVSVFQESVNDNYDQFVNHVAATRKIEAATIKNSIGAHLYGEQGALDRKLIDGIASREQAYNQLAEAADLKWGDFKVVRDSPLASGDIFSTLGAKFFGVKIHAETKQAKASPSGMPAVCTQTSAPLAYHGNLLQLCKVN